MKRTSSMIYKETVESRELFLYAVNDGDLYRGRITAIIENLQKKVKRGVYDKEKAVDLWFYAATDASEKYNREFGYKFSVQERFTVAVEMEEYYKEQVEAA